MTPIQFEMAKAALGLKNPALAEITGVHRNTLVRINKGIAKASTVARVREALEARGIQFLSEGDAAVSPGIAFAAVRAED